MKNKVDEELEFADETALNLTNFRHIEWEWEDEHHVVVSNCEDCDASDVMYAVLDTVGIAEHCLEPMGWHSYEITTDEEWDEIEHTPGAKYKIGLTDL